MKKNPAHPYALRVARAKDLFRVLREPMWFARDILGYDRFSEEFHGPMLLDMWDKFLRRPLVLEAVREQVESAILPRPFLEELETRIAERGLYYKNTGNCWARDHYKTTVKIAQCAMMILLWPEITIAHWHAVEKTAIDCSLELGHHFAANDKFRALRPEIMPPKTNKQFSTAAGFTVVTRAEVRGRFAGKERHATFGPKGATAEATGRHAIVGWLDDIVGQTTIDDSGMPKVRRWLAHTVPHVVRTDGGWLDATYTPWDEDDVMVDWESNKELWGVRVRACCETDGKPDYNGKPVLYDKRWIKRKRADKQTNFPYQMMCDRVPDSERRWPAKWDGFCTRKSALEGAGCIFILSDPAPMGMSIRGDKDRVRGDTGKDFWALAAVRLRVRGDFQDLIVMDGAASREWTIGQGYDEGCRLMKKWRTNKFFDEDYSGGQNFAEFLKACTRASVIPYSEYDGKHRRMWPKYRESYIKGAKNKRFQKTCDLAESGGVWISDTCPKEFWKGDGEITGFLTQAKKWIPRARGESSLKNDDHFDVVARATDSKLQDFAPQPHAVSIGELGLGPGEVFIDEEYEEPQRTRYSGL